MEPVIRDKGAVRSTEEDNVSSVDHHISYQLGNATFKAVLLIPIRDFVGLAQENTHWSEASVPFLTAHKLKMENA